MIENIKSISIDIKDLRWGKYPVPILPKCLRLIWRHEPLPKWLCNDLGLSNKSKIIGLDSNAWNKIQEINPRIKNYLRFIIRTRRNEIENLECWENNLWPLGLNLNDISMEYKIKNELTARSIFSDSVEFFKLTFGDLLSFRSVGPTAVLDFVSTVDYVLDYFEEINSSFNSQLENCDFKSLSSDEWLGQIYFNDPRFSSYLLPREESLKEVIEDLINTPPNPEDLKILPMLKNSVFQIKKLKLEIDQTTLEEVLKNMISLLTRSSDWKRVMVIAERFGWSGKKPQTLEECGKKLGITRERIRQIQNSFIKKIPDREIYFPQLDNALDILEKIAPIELNSATQLLKDAGLTKIDFNMHGLLEAAKIFKRDNSLSICEMDEGELLINTPENKIYQIIKSSARKLSRKSGVSNVYQVANEIEKREIYISEEDCKKILHELKEVIFLDLDWFWFSDNYDSRNRIYNISRKMLSVVSSLNVIDIRDGIRRVYKWRESSGGIQNLTIPPISVLRDFYDKHKSFSIENGAVHIKEIIDYKQELGEAERVFVDVIRSSPSGLIDRDSLAKQCFSRGLNEGTFGVLTSYSPILENVDINIWKLRGTKIDPASIEAMREFNKLKPREKRIIDYGWNSDGTLWIATRVPRQSSNIVIGTPSSIKRFLIGCEFHALSKEDKKECGLIKIDDRGTSYGYGTFVRRYGLDYNDILLAEFDIEKNIAYLTAGDENLLED